MGKKSTRSGPVDRRRARRFGRRIVRVRRRRGAPFARFFRTLILVLGCLVSLQERGSTAAEVSRELRIRAALLQWIPFYIEWPPTAFPTKDAPLLIGILGPDPFRQSLESLLDKKVDGREVKVVRFDSLESLRDCHVLYVNLPERKDVQRALEMVRDKPILTVSDQDTFTEQGGMISLLKYKNHIKPYINNAAARRAGLVIQSSLLTVSEITNP